MGAVDVGGDKPQKGKKGLRRPKRRIGIKIDMTPMVDIAFLLLIFYMVSTVFAEPQAMEVNLPPTSDEETPTAQSRVLTIRVDAADQIYTSMGDGDPQAIEMESLVDTLQHKVSTIPELITVIKINKGARYSRMVKILDAIEVVEYRTQQVDTEFSYTFSLAPWTRLDTRKVEAVGGSTGSSTDGEGEASP